MKLKIIYLLTILLVLLLPAYGRGDPCVNEIVQPDIKTKLKAQKMVIQNWLITEGTTQQLFQKLTAIPPCAQCVTDADCILTHKEISSVLGALKENQDFLACCAGGGTRCGEIELSSDSYIPLNQEWIVQQIDNYCHTTLIPNREGTKLCPAKPRCPSKISGNNMFYSAKCVSQRCIKHYSR